MSWLKTARGVVVRWGKPARFAVRHVISAAVPGGSLIADAVDKVLECVQDTAEDHEKAEARARIILSAQDLERVGSILDECNGHLASLMDQVVKLDGLPESANRITLMAENMIRQQRATDERIQAGFANIARFAEQFDRIEAGVGRVEAKVDRMEEQIRQLAERNHVRADAARKLTVTITNEKEREVLRKLRDEYRKLPPEQQKVESLTLLADSLSAAGQFSQAQEMHAEAARRAAAENKSLAAKNHYQRYRDACEFGQWPVALEALLEAARLDPAYRPFSLVQYVPKMILGTGGFGTVLRCEDRYAVAEERAVAVKTLHMADLAREVHEVFAEAHIIKTLKHPAIIGVRTWGCFDDDEARPFIVMEYFEGDSLAKHLRQHGKLEPGEAVMIARQVASGMSAAHKAGVYHRDLKPDNILVRRVPSPFAHSGRAVGGEGDRWEVRLIDFGLAVRQQTASKSVLCPPDSRSASDRSYAGTFKYAPPEQKNEADPISGKIEKVGPYSDVYTFGKTFCEALFGTTAPKGFHYDKLPENYQPLHNLLERCTADAVEERFADFGEVLAKLDALDPRRREGEEGLRRLVLTALNRTGGKPTADDTAVAKSLCQRYQLPADRANAIVREVKDFWQREREEQEREQKRLEADRLKQEQEERLRRAEEARKVEEGRRQHEQEGGKIGDTIEVPLTEALRMKLAWVPPGRSWLGGGGGKPGTQEFTLAKGLWCGVYPVTQAEWQAVMGNNPSNFAGHPRNPVEQVSWDDVQEFLQKLNSRLAEGGLTYRLPSEAEWEYICRGGPISQAQSAFHFYFARSMTDLTSAPTNDLSSGLVGQANFVGNYPVGSASKGPYLQATSEVGLYRPNPLGIYDLHGNVWEWTSTPKGSSRRVRGGSWGSIAEACSASFRDRHKPGYRDLDLGFRVLAVPSGAK